MMRKGVSILLVLLVALPLAAVAISGCGKPSAEEAKAQFDSDLQKLEQSLTVLIDPNTYLSKDNFDTAMNDIEKSYNDAVKSGKEVKDVKLSDLQDSWKNLKKAVGDITSNASLQQKVTDIQNAVADFEEAVQHLIIGLDVK